MPGYVIHFFPAGSVVEMLLYVLPAVYVIVKSVSFVTINPIGEVSFPVRVLTMKSTG